MGPPAPPSTSPTTPTTPTTTPRHHQAVQHQAAAVARSHWGDEGACALAASRVHVHFCGSSVSSSAAAAPLHRNRRPRVVSPATKLHQDHHAQRGGGAAVLPAEAVHGDAGHVTHQLPQVVLFCCIVLWCCQSRCSWTIAAGCMSPCAAALWQRLASLRSPASA
jgi:hypothetical protein